MILHLSTIASALSAWFYFLGYGIEMKSPLSFSIVESWSYSMLVLKQLIRSPFNFLKLARLVPWRLTAAVVALGASIPLSKFISYYSMRDVAIGQPIENTFNFFSGVWIYFSYLALVYYLLIMPLQRKLREDS